MPVIETKNITKRYASHLALDQVSIDVPQGSVFGLLGPNGAGKTSLIRIITRITAPDEGEVFFNGDRLKEEHIYRMGYLPEERGLYKKMEVGEQLLYFARLKGLTRHDALVKLKDWVEKFEIKSWWNKKVEELSKGMQQKIQFIATVVHKPHLIILDEPFSGFDPINVNLVTTEILRLREEGASIIFSTHRMESVEQLCDYITLINRSKKVLEGSVKSVREQFRTHTYILEYSGGNLVTGDVAEILSDVEDGEGRRKAVVHLQEQGSSNELLKQVMNGVTVLKFEEQLPGMQEIFIRVVEERGPGISLAS